MRILEAKNYEEMSALAAGVIGAQVLLQPRCVPGHGLQPHRHL